MPEFFNVTFTTGALGGTATCLVQNANNYGGTSIISAVAGSVTAGGGGGGAAIDWDETLLTRGSVSYPLTLNCKIPGSWRMGLIQYYTAT